MENILSYIYWRKDLSFEDRSFNTVDALILAELSYVEWGGIVRDVPITINEACKLYIQLHSEEEMKRRYTYSANIPLLIKELQNTKRFKNVKMKNYESIFDAEKEIQYAAITFVLPDNTHFIGYRGTDSSMVGWKEDMKMTYQDEIPSYQLAQEYLKKVFADLVPETSLFGFRRKMIYPKLYLGGHSKGGNLAMRAGICVKEMHDKITAIYNFDGPGFRKSFYEKHDFTTILPKITTYLPESSIIGRLLEHKEKNVIFDACESGLSQHDSFCWKVNAEGFNIVDKFSKESDDTRVYVDKMLMSKPVEQRKAFIEMVFSIFDKLDISTINDLSEFGLKKGLNGIKELSVLNSEERKFVLEVMGFLWMQTKSILFTKK